MFVIFAFSAGAAAEVVLEERQSLRTEEGLLLSPFWAQEFIGADLVKSEMRSEVFESVPFAIYDSGFEREQIRVREDVTVDGGMNGRRIVIGHHGTSVASVINGRGMMSVSEVVDYVQLRRVEPAGFYTLAFREIEKLERTPRIISNSMGWSAESVLKVAQQADAQGMIWVHASGNDHPKTVAAHEQAAPVISVGSSSPLGLQAGSSQAHGGLDVLAPSDEYLASIDGKGRPVLFGGTSGAAPLISGSIANALAVMPGLERRHIEELLRLTSSPGIHTRWTPWNRAGHFNGYLFYRVVRRLRDLCGSEMTCVEGEMRRAGLVVFPRTELSARIRRVCDETRILSLTEMNLLRREYLLSKRAGDFARLLECAYRAEGYDGNAEGIQNLRLVTEDPVALIERIRVLARLAVLKNWRNSPALRDLEILDERFEAALQAVIQDNTGLGSFNAKILLERYRTLRGSSRHQGPM